MGARAWGPGVQLGLWDVLVLAIVAGLFAWRGTLIRHWRGRRPTDPESVGLTSRAARRRYRSAA